MKKNVLIGIAVLLLSVSSIWLLTRPESLGNISNSYSEPTTTRSTISFSGETGDRIKFSFRSRTQSGDFDVILYNSDGNEVYKLDKVCIMLLSVS